MAIKYQIAPKAKLMVIIMELIDLNKEIEYKLPRSPNTTETIKHAIELLNTALSHLKTKT